MRYLLFCYCLFLGSLVSAQNAKIDSLKKVIATTKVDTVKRRAMCRLCGYLDDNGQFQEALTQAEMGMALVKKAKDVKGQAICHLKLGEVYLYSLKDYERAIQNFRESLKQYTVADDQGGLALANNHLGSAYHSTGDLNTAFEFYKTGRLIAERHGLKRQLAQIYKNIGSLKEKQTSYADAVRNYQASIKLYESLGDSDKVASVLTGLGSVYFYLGDRPRALKIFLRGLKIAESIREPYAISNALNSVGNIYYYNNNYIEALNYYRRSFKIAEELDHNILKALGYNNLAGVYAAQKDYKNALLYYQKSLEIKRKLKDKYAICSSLANMGGMYVGSKQPDSAFKYFQEALNIAIKLNDREMLALIKTEMGVLHGTLLNQPIIAKKELREALQIAQEIHHTEYISDAAAKLSRIDSALGDYKSAYEHYKLYTQYKDSLFNEDKAKEFGRIESKFQFEKEAEEAKRKQEELAKVEAQETQRRNNLQYLTIFAGIIGLFAGLAFMGKFRIPTRVLDAAIFAGLLILFEFLLILFDPLFEKYSGGIPFYKLGFNTVVAFAFAPLHGFLEDKLRKRLVKSSS